MKGAETSQEAVIVSWVRGQGGKAEIVGIKGVPTMYQALFWDLWIWQGKTEALLPWDLHSSERNQTINKLTNVFI